MDDNYQGSRDAAAEFGRQAEAAASAARAGLDALKNGAPKATPQQPKPANDGGITININRP